MNLSHKVIDYKNLLLFNFFSLDGVLYRKIYLTTLKSKVLPLKTLCMKIKYRCHHKTSDWTEFFKDVNTFDEAQLEETLNWWWIEKIISNWVNDD